ncbi:uncharacterized protein LOC110077364 isoform X2 [Pogona vitticeps]
MRHPLRSAAETAAFPEAPPGQVHPKPSQEEAQASPLLAHPHRQEEEEEATLPSADSRSRCQCQAYPASDPWLPPPLHLPNNPVRNAPPS